MLIVFFDIMGLVHHACVPHGVIVNAPFYVEVLKRLKRRVHRVRRDIADDWKLPHDNVPAHTAFLVTRLLSDSNGSTISQPPYSPDVAPPDFFLFSRLKLLMKGRHFETVDNVKKACTKAIKNILRKVQRDAFDAWKSRWKRCINERGAFFETL